MRTLCPHCQGGSSSERSCVVFPAQRTGKLIAKCYRASCPTSGTAFPWGDSYSEREKDYSPKTSREPLRSTHRQWLVGRVGDECVRRLHAFSERSRVGLPVYSPLGEDVGCVLRAIDGSLPKAITQTEDGYTLGSWYGVPQSAVLAVEDQLSACYASLYTGKRTVALLGHTVCTDLVKYLYTNSLSLTLALDSDALSSASNQIKQLRSYIDIDLLVLHKDLKNLSVEELVQLC